uniref:Putative secreted protein n=1 Tax=Anopheles darlingi TaxID=43151 RepID=A0A2M4D5A7_ANODA
MMMFCLCVMCMNAYRCTALGADNFQIRVPSNPLTNCCTIFGLHSYAQLRRISFQKDFPALQTGHARETDRSFSSRIDGESSAGHVVKWFSDVDVDEGVLI